MIRAEPLGQLEDFILCLLLGGALSVLFDLFTVMGGRRRFFRHSLDLLFALCVFVANLYLFLCRGRGSFPLYYIFGIASGFFLWRKTLGRIFLPVFGKIYGFIGFLIDRIWGFLKKIIKKCKIFLKKPFSNRKKSVTIKERRNGKEAA